MRRVRLRQIAACALLSFFAFNAAARADAAYSHVGWWQITYREVEDINGCDATAQFEDQTSLEMALIQTASAKSWTVFVSNPKWDANLKKDQQYTLQFVSSGRWRGTFTVTANKELFAGNLSVEFINSLADAHTLVIMDGDGNPLTSPLSMKNSADAIKAVVNCVREHPPLAAPPQAETTPQSKEHATITGTGFFVAANLVLTNNHVVNRCTGPIQVRYPSQAEHAATIFGQDETNDLALLHTDLNSGSFATFRTKLRLGDSVAAYGFPYAGVLSASGNFTLGNVTSLSGMGDDTRFLQISTPTQPGNSGGPLFDMSGDVVGVVVGQLSALAMMKDANSVPQNVNFAIQAPIIINFLSIKGVAPTLNRTSAIPLSPADVAEVARKITIQVYCEGEAEKTSAVFGDDVIARRAERTAPGALGKISRLTNGLRLHGNWQMMNAAAR
jgi:serine protease Do